MTFDVNNRSWAERNGFPDWGLAMSWILISFILFQIVGGIVAALLFFITIEGIPDPRLLMEQTSEYLDLIFIGNSTGQVLFLGIGTWMFAKLHLSGQRRTDFLRFKWKKGVGSVLFTIVLLMITIQPVLWFLSWINAQIPVPDSLFELEQMQTDVIKNYLTADHSIWITLLHVSLIPALCEETLFRGYVLRAFEKNWGIAWAIIFSGLIFGIFHLRLSQILPLAVIGMLLGYMTWASGSIVPAIVAHLINNGGSVMMVFLYPESTFAEMSPETSPPAGLLLVSLVLSGYLIYLLYKETRTIPGTKISE